MFSDRTPQPSLYGPSSNTRADSIKYGLPGEYLNSKSRPDAKKTKAQDTEMIASLDESREVQHIPLQHS